MRTLFAEGFAELGKFAYAEKAKRLNKTLPLAAVAGLLIAVSAMPARATGAAVPAASAKVTVCHAGAGSLGDRRSISVNQNAVSAHLAHGDTLGSCPATPACVAPPVGLAGWWPGDGNAVDKVGINHGTMSGGATYASGMVGQAFSFNGLTGYVAFAGASLTNTAGWTLMAWMNLGSLHQFGMAVSNGFDNGGSGDGYAFGVGSVGAVDWLSGDLQGLLGGVAWLNTGYTFSATNQWYHVVMLNDAGTTKFYVNGVQTPNTSTSGINVPSAFTIGAQPLAGRFFNGLVDEVAIFGRALNSAEIAQIVAAGSAGMCK